MKRDMYAILGGMGLWLLLKYIHFIVATIDPEVAQALDGYFLSMLYIYIFTVIPIAVIKGE